MHTQLSRTVEAADDEAELLDVFLRCAMRFLICNHLFPNRLVEAGEESALRDDKLFKDCCRQPDSDLQLALLDGVVPDVDVALVLEVLEEDTAVFSVPYIFPAFLAKDDSSSREHLWAVRRDEFHSLRPISS